MKIETDSETLRVRDLSELDENRTEELIHEISTSLPSEVRVIEIDLAHVRMIDTAGVAVLMAIHAALSRVGLPLAWRLLNPAPPVRQLLELVRVHRLFEILPPRHVRTAA